MEVQDFSKWGWGVVLAVNGFAGWIFWSLKKSFVTQENCDSCTDSMHAKQKELEAQMHIVTQRISTAPSVQDIHRVSLELATMNGNISAMSERIEGTRASMLRIENNVNMLMDVHIGDKR